MTGHRPAAGALAFCIAATVAAWPSVAPAAADSDATGIGARGPATLQAVPGQVVVKLAGGTGRPGVGTPVPEEVRARLGAAAARTLLPDGGAWSERLAAARRHHPERSRRAPAVGALPDLSAVYVLTVPPGRDVGEFCRASRLDPAVEYCEPDSIAETLLVPDDPYFSSSGSWGQSFADLWGLHLVGAESAWDVSTGAGVLIAVIDTGVSRAPDLKFGAQLWRNPGERRGIRHVDDDGNGYVDDLYGWSFVTCEAISDTCLYAGVPGGSQRAIKDRYGHGTAVSSVIAAAGNNGRGMLGLAFGAQVMAVRGLNANGQGVASELAAAILYAAENGADVINMSWGFSQTPGFPFPQVVANAIAVARGLGVVLVAAAGNDGEELDPRLAELPAGLPGVIAVSASNPSDQLTSFSTFGSWVDLAAPGGRARRHLPAERHRPAGRYSHHWHALIVPLPLASPGQPPQHREARLPAAGRDQLFRAARGSRCGADPLPIIPSSRPMRWNRCCARRRSTWPTRGGTCSRDTAGSTWRAPSGSTPCRSRVSRHPRTTLDCERQST